MPMLASWLCFWNWAYNFLFQLCSKSCIIGLNSVGYVYPYEGPHPKEIGILTEGMDTLSGAQYLKALSHFDYALEYAERALAENPGSFEALLLRTQLLPSDREDERESGFHQLVERDGHSVEALVGLASTLSSRNPSEAIEYLQQAIKIDPLNGGAYGRLGYSYERLGKYDEALAAYQKHSRSILVRNLVLIFVQSKKEILSSSR